MDTRVDWLPYSAASLVVGAFALLIGGAANPATGEDSAADTLRLAGMADGRWLVMAVMFFLASVALTLGLPTILPLFRRGRGGVLAIVAAGVFAVGTIGLAGYAMLLVFARALVVTDTIVIARADEAGDEAALEIFLGAWTAAFYLGALLLALALWRARSTRWWIPVLYVAFVLMVPVAAAGGAGAVLAQLGVLALALTGTAVSAVEAAGPLQGSWNGSSCTTTAETPAAGRFRG